MDVWLLILIISLSICSLLKLIFSLVYPPTSTNLLPPGPRPLPIIGNLLLFRKSFTDIEPVIRSLHAKFGPIITLHFGSLHAIFIADRFLAHQALVKEGASFSDRPLTFDGSNQNHVSTAYYGNKWRLLRRNLATVIIQSSGLKTYSHAREWALKRLLNSLKIESKSGGHPIQVLDHFQFSLFSLLVLMCFGVKYEDKKTKEIQDVVQRLLTSFGRVSMIYMTPIWPRLTKLVFNKFIAETTRVGDQQEELFIPLIKERKMLREEKLTQSNFGQVDDTLFSSSYLDKLLNLYEPEENRRLNDHELVRLCSEFLSGGTHSTSSTLQWIMANMVKYPHIQEKLYMEIKAAVGDEGEKLVKEDDLPKMPYLKAIILEGLRKHPLGPFLMPHAVTNDVVFNGYVVPKSTIVFVVNGAMGFDPTVWEDPMEFKPERFLSDENDVMKSFNIWGNGEIKMMPFGVGRRICPGHALAMLHLEYLVANLVWSFEWKAVEGDNIDMEAKQEFVMPMKNPLKVHLVPRF